MFNFKKYSRFFIHTFMYKYPVCKTKVGASIYELFKMQRTEFNCAAKSIRYRAESRLFYSLLYKSISIKCPSN